jgi:glycosyltransferase involved in cell wall biosynthesis
VNVQAVATLAGTPGTADMTTSSPLKSDTSRGWNRRLLQTGTTFNLNSGPAGQLAGEPRPIPKLRIAQVAPLAVRVPPRRYGGTERVIHSLTEELVRRGHQVTLFAAGGSVTSAELRSCAPRPLWEMAGVNSAPLKVLQVEELVRESWRFDVIHSHLEYLHWLVGERLQAPMLTTPHGPLHHENRAVFEAFRDQPLVSISHSQRTPFADLGLNWVRTVYHGLDLRRTYSLGSGKGNYLAFVGRSCADKGILQAIRVAIKCEVPLKIAARIDPGDADYHRHSVRPWLDHPLIEWLGEIDDGNKRRLLEEARALLMPINWPEPFGLAFIESLAAGTPVISRPCGALPELLCHGQHGFLVDSEDELVDAVRRCSKLDREACRDWVLERFSAERMAADYELAYLDLLEPVGPSHVEMVDRRPA